MMTRQQVQAARERAEKATPGPWSTNLSGKGEHSITGPELAYVADVYSRLAGAINYPSDEEAIGNLAFIAAARTDVPALAASLEAAMEAIRATVTENDHATCSSRTKEPCDCWQSKLLAVLATYDGAKP